MSFEALGLRAELLRALNDAGYDTPTPIQAQAIPPVLSGRDVLAGAQTGTGKTAAFALPLLQRLSAPGARPLARRGVRVLVLTPTRELAVQVEESFRDYGRHLKLTSTVVYGGVKISPQIRTLDRGVDVLVATPGRLLDHLQQGTVSLSGVEALVLDEADRMLDMGFVRDIRRIVTQLPKRRQTLLFSATFPDEILALSADFLIDPVRVEVARRSQDSELVHQAAYPVTKEGKRDLLTRLLADLNIAQALVFTRTKHGADRLAKQLGRDGVDAAVIHGDRSQPQRLRALAEFKAGTARVLVATDIAARGIDIDQLPFVINYELPNVAEDYVHRIGRTGRAGSPGTALSLVSEDEMPHLAGIEKLLQKRIERRGSDGTALAPPPEPQAQRPRARRPRRRAPIGERRA